MSDIKRTVNLQAEPETVYAWLSEPEHMQKWFCDEVEANAETLSFKWNMEGGGSAGFDVTVIEEDAPHTFMYRSTDESEITTRFDVASDGEKTIVALVESGFSDDEAGNTLRQEHEGGWDWFLSRLQTLDA